MADHEIQMADGDRVGEFYVKFHGPKSSAFSSYPCTALWALGKM